MTVKQLRGQNSISDRVMDFFSFSVIHRPDLGLNLFNENQRVIPWARRRGTKFPECEADPLPPSSAEVHNSLSSWLRALYMFTVCSN
jgi:hypothetical protein